MKKGDKVIINKIDQSRNSYKGQKDGVWTEPVTGRFKLKKRTSFFHLSGDKLTSFDEGIETCVYSEDSTLAWKQTILSRSDIKSKKITQKANRNYDDHCYLITAPKNTEITVVGDGMENRLTINRLMKIIYLGVISHCRIKTDQSSKEVYFGNLKW